MLRPPRHRVNSHAPTCRGCVGGLLCAINLCLPLIPELLAWAAAPVPVFDARAGVGRHDLTGGRQIRGNRSAADRLGPSVTLPPLLLYECATALKALCVQALSRVAR